MAQRKIQWNPAESTLFQHSIFFHHAVSQSQSHHGVGRDNLSMQDGTNICVANTITLVIKESAASTDLGISK